MFSRLKITETEMKSRMYIFAFAVAYAYAVFVYIQYDMCLYILGTVMSYVHHYNTDSHSAILSLQKKSYVLHLPGTPSQPDGSPCWASPLAFGLIGTYRPSLYKLHLPGLPLSSVYSWKVNFFEQRITNK